MSFGVQPAAAPWPQPATRRHYVISAPTGYALATSRFRDALSALENSSDPRILSSLGANDEKLAELSDAEVQALKAKHPSLVVEPNLQYRRFLHPYLQDFSELVQSFSGGTPLSTLRIVDSLTGTPVVGAEVICVVRRIGKGTEGFRRVTGLEGVCAVPPMNYESVVIDPPCAYWSKLLTDCDLTNSREEQLTAFREPPEPGRYDWGHTFSRMSPGLAHGGERVKVAIVDTGVYKDHNDLSVSGGYNCVQAENAENWFEDQDGHGTHCAGIVAALGNALGSYVPRCEIRSYRVFPTQANASTFDILRALDRAVSDGCDIVSMSFGNSSPSNALRSRVEDAYENGVFCVAAVGNDSEASVSFPAGFYGVAGVSAFGMFGAYPDDSVHRLSESPVLSSDGRYCAAGFANHGDNVDFCAPGVAIRSTVPKGYRVLDGTSMSCPHVAGIAALALAADPDLLMANRDADRAERITSVLRGMARPLGFGADYEGAGALYLDVIENPFV